MPAETPSPSPLTLVRAETLKAVAVMLDAHPVRRLTERDSLAARVSDLEAEQKKRDEHAEEVATILDDTAMRHYEALESLRAKAQEVRRAWDARSGDADLGDVQAAIDALCPAAPVLEDKKEAGK